MNVPLISVVIPSYNHSRFVGEAIRSALNQTWQNLELIVIDDASTDDSAQVLAAIRDPRFRFAVLPENLGAPAAMNEGVRQAKGEFVAVMGSDDLMAGDRLERQLQILSTRPELAAVFSQVATIDEHGLPYPDQAATPAGGFAQPNRSRQQHLAYMFEHGNCFCQPSALVRRRCFEELGLFDERLAQLQDFDFWLRVLTRHEIHIQEEQLTFYRWFRSGTNLSAPSIGRMSRILWETSHVLKHYLSLDWPDLAVIFGTTAVSHYRAMEAPPQLLTIDAAAANPRPEYQLFALNELYRLLPAYGQTGPLHKHLMRLAEQCDPLRAKLCWSLQQRSAGQAG
jgi:glycosyltransferase involved in cell wall biosynthesis